MHTWNIKKIKCLTRHLRMHAKNIIFIYIIELRRLFIVLRINEEKYLFSLYVYFLYIYTFSIFVFVYFSIFSILLFLYFCIFGTFRFLYFPLFAFLHFSFFVFSFLSFLLSKRKINRHTFMHDIIMITILFELSYSTYYKKFFRVES